MHPDHNCSSCHRVRHTTQNMIRYQVRFAYVCCNTFSLSVTSELVVLKLQAELGAETVN